MLKGTALGQHLSKPVVVGVNTNWLQLTPKIQFGTKQCVPNVNSKKLKTVVSPS
ncbi:hypothetical protein DPMN_055254 [Dreissena polymorpha]|uniref:Uncharacterized protein n=1 Tax=Dreissena polymorpha TaxID=45954 RepID=A0A9D4CR20_DREPO|nr:hypothetical protein DPMN_055254 [Dreissena polymorpha]